MWRRPGCEFQTVWVWKLQCNLQHYLLKMSAHSQHECCWEYWASAEYTIKLFGLMHVPHKCYRGQTIRQMSWRPKGRGFDSSAAWQSRWEMHNYSSTSTAKVPLNDVWWPTTQVLGSTQAYNESKTLQYSTFVLVDCTLVCCFGEYFSNQKQWCHTQCWQSYVLLLEKTELHTVKFYWAPCRR